MKSEFVIVIIEKFYIDTIIIIQLLNDFMNDENDEKIKNFDRIIFDISTKNMNIDSKKKLSEFTNLFRDMKRNVHIERFFSDFQNFVDENLENVDFFNINEFRTIKFKNRSKNTKNKKDFMTRANKKAIKSTRRNFSNFEHVETIINEIFQNRNRNRNRNRSVREDRKKKVRKNRKERDETTREKRDKEVRNSRKNRKNRKKNESFRSY